jgi:tetratricopeptide (TPR) repeat protein
MKLPWPKSCSAIVFSIVSLSLSPHLFGQGAQAQKREIYRLLSAQQFSQAEQAARAYLSAHPGDCNVSVMLGIALRGESKAEPAFKAFRSAVKECPQSLAAIEGAAESAYALDRPDAKSFINQVIQLRPTDETSYAMLGAIDARTGDCAGAVDSYAKAPSQVNQSPPALQQYSSCLMILDRPAEAVSVLSQLLALQNQSANRIAVARAQIAAKEQTAALATLQPLLDAGSRNSEAFLLAAQLAEDQNETPKAVEWLRKAIELDPQNVNAYLAFSEICFNHGSFKIGIDFLNLGIQQLPSEARLYLARGVLEEQMTQVDAALGDFEKAHQLNPQLSFAEDAMGMLLSQKHDPEAALVLFTKQSQLHPNDPLLQYLYAEALSQTANADEKVIEKAISTARRAVRLEPTYQPARDLLCVLLLRHNDLAETIAEAQEAIKHDPYDEAAIYQELLAEHKLKHSARITALVKQLQEAKSHNEKAKTKYVLEEAQSSNSPH